ncbi:hypothetical protein [Paraburkholderia acidicola]|nr:hypothetical protein [Paraburkholderia acidicola]
MNTNDRKPFRMLNKVAARTMPTRAEALSESIGCHAYGRKLDVPFNRK